MKRFLAFVLATLTLFSLASCRGKEDEPKGEEEKPSVSQKNPEEDKFVSVFDEKEDTEGLLPYYKVGKFEISRAMNYYCTQFEIQEMSKGDEEYFVKHPEKMAELEKKVKDELLKMAIPFALAEKFGIKEDPKWEEQFVNDVKRLEVTYKMQTGQSLSEYFKKSHMTLSVYKTIYYMNEFYEPAVVKHLSDPKNGLLVISPEEVEKALPEYRTVKHILVGFSKEVTEKDALELANSLIARIKEGESFDELMKKHSADYNEKRDNVYTFTKGQMVKPFEEAAFDLKENELSQPVKSQFGYHIILRLPIDKVAVEKALKPAAAAKYVTEFSKTVKLEKV